MNKIARVNSATITGVDGVPVSVEVHVSNGLPSFSIVGLPDAACREARDRVRAALLSSGLSWPTRRVTVNLAPSGVRKVGTGFDLPIAMGLLVATEVLPPDVIESAGFVGELGLDGRLRPVGGVVALADAIEGPTVFVPVANARHASLVKDRSVVGVETLRELIDALSGAGTWPQQPTWEFDDAVPTADMCDVRGQAVARWAVEVAAAGGHNLLLMGPPGAGKTMLANRVVGLLPDLDDATALVCTRIHSAAGVLDLDRGLMRRPPVRAPHHTSSLVAIIGGGTGLMRPGEISLSHGGVLVLDELCEFGRPVLEALRQPLEDGVVRVARACGSARFPARCQLVATTNPCPCGHWDGVHECECDGSSRARYRSRLSGPLLDRFDMRLFVKRPDSSEFFGSEPSESSVGVAGRIAGARERASSRGVRCNAELDEEAFRRFANLSRNALSLLRKRLEHGKISGRGIDRVCKVALTIADLEGADPPLSELHVAAALEMHSDLKAA